MEEGTSSETLPRRALSSFTTSVGLALGELLIAFGRPEDLDICLFDIHTAAQGTILSFDLARPSMGGDDS